MLCAEVDGLVRRANVAGACETLKGRLPTGLQDAILPHGERFMSIAGYFGPSPLDLRVEAGDLSRGNHGGSHGGFEWTIAGGGGEGAAVIR